ncbi:hypothetical protein BDB01DRAFT_719115 [Pilobolus umbonatus]|nr:hypothetical protein BDB01DRAFT_719115 [Pilobolus umbonatus]
MDTETENISEFYFDRYEQYSKHTQDDESALKDEYCTITSSTISSALSLENALFSNISSDIQSEITVFSNIPKIEDINVQYQGSTQNGQLSISSNGLSSPLFDRHIDTPYIVATGSDATHVTDLENQKHWEKYLCKLYHQALYHLSPTSATHTNRVLALDYFLLIAAKGEALYKSLTKQSQVLVSFAQYRAGHMLIDDAHKVEEGMTYLQKSSLNGNNQAKFMLGVYEEQNGNLSNAIELFYQAALTGVVSAKISLARILLFTKLPTGLMDKYDSWKEKCISMLNELSLQKNTTASITLALYYDNKNQIEKAIEYCRDVIVGSNSPICGITNYVMGIIHLKGGPKYAEDAFRYIQRSASIIYTNNGTESKSLIALRKLGIFYLNGIGTKVDPDKAFDCICEAANYEDEESKIILAQLYLQGTGCQPNREVALNILNTCKYSIAAKLSRGLLIKSINQVEALKEFNAVLNYEIMSNQPYHWNTQLIKQEAFLQISLLTYDGLGGLSQDRELAYRNLKELSDEHNYNEAHYHLGMIHLKGISNSKNTVVLPPNKDEAFRYFLKGADAGKINCFYRIGQMLQNGYYNTHFKKEMAFKYFEKAASQGHTPSQTQMGIYYFHGNFPVKKDLELAFHYFSSAAKKNDTFAYLYLADYLIHKRYSLGELNTNQILKEVCDIATSESSNVKEKSAAYRLLALIIENGIPPEYIFKFNRHNDLVSLYEDAKRQANDSYSVKFRFSLNCLWKAVELSDHLSGNYLCDFYIKMTKDDRIQTLNILKKYENHGLGKMSIVLAKYLYVSNERVSAMKKYMEIALQNRLNTSVGWKSAIEAAKLVIDEGIGKATSKHEVFRWLNEMIRLDDSNVLFMPYALLAKCHELTLCQNCDVKLSTVYYEKSLKHKSTDSLLELKIRMNLLKTYYEAFDDEQLKHMINTVYSLIDGIGSAVDTRSFQASLYYYQGLYLLHNDSHYSKDINSVVGLLCRSSQMGNILAEQELGYIYGTVKDKENEANEHFENVHKSSKTPIILKGNGVEAEVLTRRNHHRTAQDYNKDIERMKMAAVLTYTEYHMERQALDWLKEVAYDPLAQIMMLYYKMKKPPERTAANFHRLFNLVSQVDTKENIEHNGRKVLSYGYFSLGQCVEEGRGVDQDDMLAYQYYEKASTFFGTYETYQRMANIAKRSRGYFSQNLLTILINAARINADASFQLAEYYEQQPLTEANIKNSQNYYYKASQNGHPEACYRYAKNFLHQIEKTDIYGTKNSTKAIKFLNIAASKNHGPAYYELGIRKLKVGLFEEGVDDLKEADFLNCHEASFKLGELYYNGSNGYVMGNLLYKVAVSYSTSYMYFKRAVDNGNVMAMLKLGHFYEHGVHVTQNLSTAQEWYKQAYLTKKCPEGAAEYALGCLEETATESAKPTLISQHRSTAFQWFQKALEANNQSAKFKIGYYWLNQWVNTGSQEQGLSLLIEASDNSDIKAMNALSVYYEERGMYDEAFDNLLKAESLCDPEAIDRIADCYVKGLLGREIDLAKASELRQRAADFRK